MGWFLFSLDVDKIVESLLSFTHEMIDIAIETEKRFELNLNCKYAADVVALYLCFAFYGKIGLLLSLIPFISARIVWLINFSLVFS